MPGGENRARYSVSRCLSPQEYLSLSRAFFFCCLSLKRLLRKAQRVSAGKKNVSEGDASVFASFGGVDYVSRICVVGGSPKSMILGFAGGVSLTRRPDRRAPNMMARRQQFDSRY